MGGKHRKEAAIEQNSRGGYSSLGVTGWVWPGRWDRQSCCVKAAEQRGQRKSEPLGDAIGRGRKTGADGRYEDMISPEVSSSELHTAERSCPKGDLVADTNKASGAFARG